MDKNLNISVLKAFSVVLVAMCLFSCTSNEYYLAEPKEQVFVLDQHHNIYELDVEVKKQAMYLMPIQVFYSEDIYIEKRKPSPEEAKLLGDFFKKYDYNLPIKAHVHVVNKDTNEVVLDKVVENPNARAHAHGRIVTIMRLMLPKGKYDIRLKYLEGDTQLNKLYMRLKFYRNISK